MYFLLQKYENLTKGKVGWEQKMAMSAREQVEGLLVIEELKPIQNNKNSLKS